MLDLGPPPAALLPHSPGPYVALVLVGFAVGTLGHLTKTRWLVAAGVLLLAIGALALPLAAGLPSNHQPPPIEESGGQVGE